MRNQVWGKVGESSQYFGKEHRMLSNGYIRMQNESPSADHIACEDGTWVIPDERLGELYAAELAALDPMLSHIQRHERNGELEAAGRAELAFKIKQAEIMEKYNRGVLVYFTETGSCYHSSPECPSLSDNEAKPLPLSEALKYYSECSVCAV